MLSEDSDVYKEIKLSDGAPILDVVLTHTEEYAKELEANGKRSQKITVRALIDTGANRTSIDNELAKKLHLKPVDKYYLYTPTGEPKEEYRYTGLTFLMPTCGSEFSPPLVPGSHLKKMDVKKTGVQMVIGRDILRKGKLVYDGPNASFWFEESSIPA